MKNRNYRLLDLVEHGRLRLVLVVFFDRVLYALAHHLIQLSFVHVSPYSGSDFGHQDNQEEDEELKHPPEGGGNSKQKQL